MLSSCSTVLDIFETLLGVCCFEIKTSKKKSSSQQETAAATNFLHDISISLPLVSINCIIETSPSDKQKQQQHILD
jgi:hypothetical protein